MVRCFLLGSRFRSLLLALIIFALCLLPLSIPAIAGAASLSSGTASEKSFCAGPEIGSIMVGLNLGAAGQADDGAMGLLLNLLGYPGNKGQADNYTLMTGRLDEMDNTLDTSASHLTDKLDLLGITPKEFFDAGAIDPKEAFEKISELHETLKTNTEGKNLPPVTKRKLPSLPKRSMGITRRKGM